MKKILIAPWGNPFAWRSVNYIFETNGKVKEKESVSSISILNEVIKPDEIYIFVSDTLSKLNNENYDEIVMDIKKQILDFISNKNLDINVDENNIIVCPGVGTYGGIKFNGKMLDYYTFILYNLSKILSNYKDVEIHLDLTHGINYMPALMYRAVKELLGIQAIKYKAKLITYNSEPFVGREESPKLKIHMVENTEIRPQPPTEIIEKNEYFEIYAKNEEIGKIRSNINNKLIKNLRDYKKNINALILSHIYSLPLLLTTYYIEPKILEHEIDNLFKIYKDHIIIVKNKELIKKLGFTNDINTLIKAYLLSNISNLDIIKKELSLKEIEEINNKLFKSVFIENEIKKIPGEIFRILEDNNRDIKFNSWMPLSNLYTYGSGFEIRNFLAHCGFEMNVSEIYIDESVKEIFKKIFEEIKYIDDKNKAKGKFVENVKDKIKLRYNINKLKEINIIEKLEDNYKQSF